MGGPAARPSADAHHVAPGGPLQEGRAWYGALAPGKAAAVGEENHADFLAVIRDPATVRAMLEDYRAGLGIDRAAEEAPEEPAGALLPFLNG